MKKLQNIYIHIPFCSKKCLYCDFPVHALGQASKPQFVSNSQIHLTSKEAHNNKIIESYLKSLKKEIHSELKN